MQGRSSASEIVTDLLQREPDVNYIVPAWSDGAIGVPQALKSAGLTDKVTWLPRVPGPVNLKQIQQIESPAFVPESTYVEAWMMVDALARHFVGDSLPVDEYASGPHQYLTPDNL